MLKNINMVDLDKVINSLVKEFGIENLYIKYWEDEECREEGISTIYYPIESELRDIMHEARRLVDKNSFASVEVLVDDEEDPLYFYDGETEEILVL